MTTPRRVVLRWDPDIHECADISVRTRNEPYNYVSLFLEAWNGGRWVRPALGLHHRANIQADDDIQDWIGRSWTAESVADLRQAPLVGAWLWGRAVEMLNQQSGSPR